MLFMSLLSLMSWVNSHCTLHLTNHFNSKFAKKWSFMFISSKVLLKSLAIVWELLIYLIVFFLENVNVIVNDWWMKHDTLG